MHAKSFQSYPTLCNPIVHSLARFLCPWGFSRQNYCSGLPCSPQWGHRVRHDERIHGAAARLWQTNTVIVSSMSESTSVKVLLPRPIILQCPLKTRMDMNTLLHLKWITNNDLLYSIQNSAQCYAAAWMGGEFMGEWIHVYVWLSSSVVHLKLS